MSSPENDEADTSAPSPSTKDTHDDILKPAGTPPLTDAEVQEFLQTNEDSSSAERPLQCIPLPDQGQYCLPPQPSQNSMLIKEVRKQILPQYTKEQIQNARACAKIVYQINHLEAENSPGCLVAVSLVVGATAGSAYYLLHNDNISDALLFTAICTFAHHVITVIEKENNVYEKLQSFLGLPPSPTQKDLVSQFRRKFSVDQKDLVLEELHNILPSFMLFNKVRDLLPELFLDDHEETTDAHVDENI